MLAEAVGETVPSRHVAGNLSQHLLERLVRRLPRHQFERAHDGHARLQDDGELIAHDGQFLVARARAAQTQVGAAARARFVNRFDDKPRFAEFFHRSFGRVCFDDAVNTRAGNRTSFVVECPHACCLLLA